ncbi:hypothetical protein SLEP1_g50351 [Rubroshorea leprosula]|nr:hypothetical protein SLEP1_g50351 [Rubroshorea leprosula]
MAQLDACRSEILGRSAFIIQRKVCSYLTRRSFVLLRLCANTYSICMQRGDLARKIYDGMRRETACLRIQRGLRRHLARKAYKELCSSAVPIQTGMHGMAARNELCLRRQTRAAIKIQSQCRKYLAQLHYVKLKKSSITTQCAWRGRVARKELRKLKMAARETRALQAAKNKLEKQVEELTWRLQLERCMRVDIEEAKTQENAQLHSALEEVQLQFKETKELLRKECEAARRTAEVVPIIQKVSVVNHEMLKELVSSLEKKIDETEKKLVETNKISEERLKQALEAESKIIHLKTAMNSLEEKIIDMESENKFLRQQNLLCSAIKKISEHPPISPLQVNICLVWKMETMWMKRTNQIHSFHWNHQMQPQLRSTESDVNFGRSLLDHQHDNVDAPMNCVSKNIGFSQGKPVAAFTIYKSLLHWKSFEAERTSVFDHLIRLIGSAIENEDNNDQMAYWLSNTSTLLFLLERSLKSAGSALSRKPPSTTSLFGRMAKSFRLSPSNNLAAAAAALAVVWQVQAKQPALLFMPQVAAYVEKICGIIRDNLKKEFHSLLMYPAPRTSKGSILRSGRSFGKDSSSSHWQSIIYSLNTLLCTLKENFVPPVLVQKIFTQTFSYFNVQLFNSLLLHRECCTFSNGEYVKSGLAELELWSCQAKEEYSGSSWDELKHIRQAVGFLVTHQKYRISYDEITNDLCPILSVQQLYRMCTLYWDESDDNYNTRSVSPDVISSMRILMTEESNSAESSSFLLDDNSRIRFSVVDLSNSIPLKDFLDVQPAEELLENPAFQFLHE